MWLILLGAPGSGKGTQAERLVKKYRIPHISSGNILRQAIENKTELGAIAATYIQQGKLVPDEIIIQVIEKRLSQPDCGAGFVLDGFPRTVAQTESLGKWIGKVNLSLTAVIYLQVSEKTLIARLSNRRVCRECQAVYHLVNHPSKHQGKCDLCGGNLVQRPDDNEEIVQQRLTVYNEQTAPLLAYYQQVGILYRINGETDAENIFNHIIKEIST